MKATDAVISAYHEELNSARKWIKVVQDVLRNTSTENIHRIYESIPLTLLHFLHLLPGHMQIHHI